MRAAAWTRTASPLNCPDASEQAGTRFSGFLAQEVEAAAKSVGYEFSAVDAPKNAESMYGLRYAEFVVPLVKAVQEQQELIQKQQELMEHMNERIRQLEAR